MSKPPKLETKLPKGVSPDFDRHGNMRLYFRATGRGKVRLHETPGTEKFEKEVAAARLGIPWHSDAVPQPEQPVAPAAASGTLLWLVTTYKKRARGTVSADLFERRVRMLEEICQSKRGKAERERGTLPYALMELQHVTELRDELRQTAGARTNVVKALSALFAWAKENGLAKVNPCAGIKRVKSGDGFHTWTVDEVRQFEAQHGPDTKARLCLHLALFTGLRRSDLVAVGQQHVKDGWLVIRPGKTAGSSNVTVEIPILDALAETIESARAGKMTWLVTDYGSPYTDDGLGNRFRKWATAAGLPHCTLHGLRKAGATIAAENGATDDQLMAIFGWTTKQQTTLYTAKANRRKLAAAGIKHLRLEQNPDKIVPPVLEVDKSGTKKVKKSSKNND